MTMLILHWGTVDSAANTILVLNPALGPLCMQNHEMATVAAHTTTRDRPDMN